MSCIERFMPLVVEKEDEGKSSPVITDRDVTFVYTKHMNLFRKLVSATSCVYCGTVY